MYRPIRLLVLAPVFLSLVSISPAQSSGGNVYPLPETYFPGLASLIETAAKQSPRMTARNTENAIAEADRITARSGQLPSAGGYFSYYPWVNETRAVAGQDSGGNPLPDQKLTPTKIAYNFTITQPIFHWGALRNNTRIGELQQKITEGQTADAYRVLVDEIRAQYLQVIVNKVALARSRFNEKVSDDQLTLARSKREKNVISEADLFGPTIAAEQARLAADRAADDYESSRIYLGKLCGSAPLSDDQVPTEIPPITPASSGLQEVITEFTRHEELDTYALQALRDQIESERLNYKVASTRLLPKFNLAAGTSQDEQSYSVDITNKYKVQSYYAGATINWSIFDGFAARSAKVSSLARRRQLEANYRNQTADTIAAVKTQMRQLEFTSRNLSIVERMLGSAGNMLTARKEDIARGIASEADVNAAQSAFYDWQLAAFGARNEYMMRVAKLLSATQQDPALANSPVQLR